MMLMTCVIVYEYMRYWVICSCIHDQVQVLMRSIGKITLISKQYDMHIESCLVYCMHMNWYDSHVFKYVIVCDDVYMTICEYLVIYVHLWWWCWIVINVNWLGDGDEACKICTWLCEPKWIYVIGDYGVNVVCSWWTLNGEYPFERGAFNLMIFCHNDDFLVYTLEVMIWIYLYLFEKTIWKYMWIL